LRTDEGLCCFRFLPGPRWSAVSLTCARLPNLSRPELRWDGTSNDPGRLTISAARANVMLVIPRIARPRHPPSVGRFGSATVGTKLGPDAHSSSPALLKGEAIGRSPRRVSAPSETSQIKFGRSGPADYQAGFAVYPGRRRLDNGTQVTDIADVSSRDADELEQGRPRSLSRDPSRFTY